MNVSELKKQIENNNIENVYLFSGPEIGEKNEIIKLIEEKIFGNQEVIKYNFYIDKNFDNIAFLETLESDLLFSNKKIIYLKNIEQINQKQIKIIENLLIPNRIYFSEMDEKIKELLHKNEDYQKIIKSCYNIQDDIYILKTTLKEKNKKELINLFNKLNFYKNKDTYLIMLNETNDKIPSELLSLLSPNQHIIFWEMFENQKTQWIRNEFKKYNLYIDDNAIDFILNSIENNKFHLQNEIQKIAIMFDAEKKDQKRVIDIKFIEDFIYHSKSETTFSLFSAMIEKDFSKSINILEKLFWTEEHIVIISGLLWSFRRLLKALYMFEFQRFNEEKILSELNIKHFKAKEEILLALKNFTFYDISIIYNYLTELDYYLRILRNDELKLVKFHQFIFSFIYGDYKNSFLNGKIKLTEF